MNRFLFGISTLTLCGLCWVWPRAAKTDPRVETTRHPTIRHTGSPNPAPAQAKSFSPSIGAEPIVKQLSHYCFRSSKDIGDAKRIDATQHYLKNLDAAKLGKLSEEAISVELTPQDKTVLNWVIQNWSALQPDDVITFLMERYPDELQNFIQTKASFAVDRFKRETGWMPLEAAWFHADELAGFWQTNLRDFIAAERTLPDYDSELTKIQARAVAEFAECRNNLSSPSPEIREAAAIQGTKLATNLAFSEITPEIYRNLVRFACPPTTANLKQPYATIAFAPVSNLALGEAIARRLSRLWKEHQEEIILQFQQIPSETERKAAILSIANSTGCTSPMNEAKLTLLKTFVGEWQELEITRRLISKLPHENSSTPNW